MPELIVSIGAGQEFDRIKTFIAEKCRQDNIPFSIKENLDIPQELVKSTRELFSKPILIGEKFAIRANTARNRHLGLLSGINAQDRTMIDIDPKMSFGIGTHQTTQMCVEALERCVESGMSVLDIGCGCGILSMVSLLLDAGFVTGVDISHEAVKTSIENAELNGVSNKFTAKVGNLTDVVNGKYDVIVANILADPIKELLRNLKSYTHDDTTVILSGIVDFRMAEVLKVAKKDFELIETHIRDNWVCLILKPKK